MQISLKVDFKHFKVCDEIKKLANTWIILAAQKPHGMNRVKWLFDPRLQGVSKVRSNVFFT